MLPAIHCRRGGPWLAALLLGCAVASPLWAGNPRPKRLNRSLRPRPKLSAPIPQPAAPQLEKNCPTGPADRSGVGPAAGRTRQPCALGLAREAINEALAIHRSARLLLIPDLNAGTNYHLHNGPLQTSFGLIRTLNEQSIYVGGGARTLAAETVAIPAVQIYTHLGDAIFLPLATEQDLAARSNQAQATENLVLLDVALAYLRLATAEARILAWRQSVSEAAEIARITGDFARTGQGREGDYRRSQGEALLLTVELQEAEAEANLASNDLARLLRLDPANRLTTLRAPIELVVLVDRQMSVQTLVDMGLVRRWEMAVNSAQVSAAQQRLRQERTRPLFPVVMVGISAGGFGGGSNQTSLGVNSFFQVFSGRDDFDVLAVWTLQNMGAGNMALAKQRRIERDTLSTQRVVLAAQIRQEVMSAAGDVAAAWRRIESADRQLAAAVRGQAEEFNRIRGGEGLPIEAINSLNLLAAARQNAIGAVLEYNLAEFRLFQAIGYRPAGDTPDPVARRPAPEPVPPPAEAANAGNPPAKELPPPEGR